MNSNGEQWNQKAMNPAWQASFVLVLGLLITFGGILCKMAGWIDVSDLFPWLINTSFILLFSMVNVVLSLSAKNLTKYWSWSIYSFMAYLLVSGLVAWAISGVAIQDAATYKWLYFMLTIIYLVFVSIARLMRFIVDLALKQDKRLRNERD